MDIDPTLKGADLVEFWHFGMATKKLVAKLEEVINTLQYE